MNHSAHVSDLKRPSVGRPQRAEENDAWADPRGRLDAERRETGAEQKAAHSGGEKSTPRQRILRTFIQAHRLSESEKVCQRSIFGFLLSW
jgi:hypothetical protein